MNEAERQVLRSNHQDLVTTLDPYMIRKFLYERNILPNATFLDDEPVRTRRAETFLEYVKDNCSFSLFLEALSNDDTYGFVAQNLQDSLDKRNKEDIVGRTIHWRRKEQIHTPWRVNAIKFRHRLKRLCLMGDTDSFQREGQIIVDRWNAIEKESILKRDNQELADMYCMVLDAHTERRRILCDKTLYKDEKLFNSMLQLAPYTSSATIPQVMYLARYGAALFVVHKPLEALSYVQRAKQLMETLPACKETGVVRYIEYNILLVDKYEANPTQHLREKLMKLMKETIDHFRQDEEMVGKDFERIILLKLAHLHLGIGLFLNYMDEDLATETGRAEATLILKEMRKPDNWERMETRWKLKFHAAKGRLLQLEGKKDQALGEVTQALKLANTGNFQREYDNLIGNKTLLIEQNDRKWKYLMFGCAVGYTIACAIHRFAW